MADLRDLTGDYATDWPIIKAMFQSLTTEMTVDNRDGETIDHSFSSTSAEEITHTLGRIPTLFEIIDIDTAGTVHRTAWDADSITLVSSDASQSVRIYVE
jgi:hypothetical protein